jgi:hypothetical protein
MYMAMQKTLQSSKIKNSTPSTIAAERLPELDDSFGAGGQVVVSVVASVATCGVVLPVMTDPVPIAPVVVGGTPTREDYYLSSTGHAVTIS